MLYEQKQELPVSAFTQGRRHNQALPLLPSKDLKAVRASLLQKNGSIFVGPKASICKPEEPQLAGAQVGAGSWNSAELTDPTRATERPREE